MNALRCSEWWPLRSGIVYGRCVSGGWLVWARWIPARAATSCLASLFSRLSKCVLALAVLGFLCWVPIARAFSRLKTSLSALCCASWGCGAGWTSKHPSCSTSRAPSNAFGLLAHGVVLGLSDAENPVGTRPLAPICPETKRSTLRANDVRCRFVRVPAAWVMRCRRQ